MVTLDTVKKHVSHVLDKLGATNRTEAVARARDYADALGATLGGLRELSLISTPPATRLAIKSFVC